MYRLMPLWKGFSRDKRAAAVTFLLSLAVLLSAVTALSYRTARVEQKKHDAFDLYIEKYAGMYGLDDVLIKSVIECESGFDPKAVSHSGACGLMQLMPATFDWMRKGEDVDIFDPETNIRYGCRYLAYLFERFGSVREVLAAYNAGEGNVSSWLRNSRYSTDGRTLRSIPFPETAEYVRRVISVYQNGDI